MVCRNAAARWTVIDIFQVPVVAVFTKFDQFRREVRMKLEDQHRDPETDLEVEMETIC